ncbi:MAG: hypothetical protein QGD90_13015 [Candidatus Hydrogenedentes bacterium]|nr:hypothetical protein [Candidatus Hydrogenedentota bacterium]
MAESFDAGLQREVYDAEFRLLESKLMDVKDRVVRLESTMARGILLLVANLAGVVMSLAQQYLRQ